MCQKKGLTLVELGGSATVDEVRRKTGAKFAVADKLGSFN